MLAVRCAVYLRMSSNRRWTTKECSMDDESEATRPETIFKQCVWRNTIDIGQALERSTTWTVGGVAAIVTLLLTNLDSVVQIASLGGTKACIVLLTLSILAGAISKQIGMAVIAGINTLKQTEALLNSEAGQSLMGQMTTEPKQLVADLATPFLWPISLFIRRGGERGLNDFAGGDKRFIKMFCLQILFNGLHGLLAIAALLSIGLTI